MASINVRELKTILFAIKLHQEQSRGKHVLLYSDNWTAIKYVMKQGGTASPILQALALSIREILTNNQITLTCQYIPGMQNTTADDLSRKTISLYEHQLPLPWFQQIRKRWKDLAIDAFAAHHNHLLPTYWTRYPDPGAAAVNAFEQ